MNTLRLASVALILLLLPACLVTRGTSNKSSGTYVSSDTLAQITDGESETFVVDLLGEPSRRIEKSGGTTVLLAWDWERKVSRKGAVLLVFAGGKEDEQRATTWVRLEDGEVTRVWQDTSEK